MRRQIGAVYCHRAVASCCWGWYWAVRSFATVLLSWRILAGLSTVPPDFTIVRIVVSSALSSVTFCCLSSGSICLISRFLSIGIFLLHLFRLGRLSRLWLYSLSFCRCCCLGCRARLRDGLLFSQEWLVQQVDVW